MTNYTTYKINKILNGTITGNNNSIEYLLTDSRKLNSPKTSLFFALIGNNHNGHDFIPDLYKKEVRNFVVSKLPDNISKYKESCFILVNNTLTALQELAAYNRKQFIIPVIGITGSNGKTIVKEWISHCLQENINIIRSPKSYNSQIGVPLSAWLINKNHEIALLEAGISMPNEMDNLQNIINPTIGIITNIGEAHQENFISITQKIDEKLKLFTNASTIIYCKDHKQIHKQITNNKEFKNKVLFTWSQESEADLSIKNITILSNTTEIEGIFNNQNYTISIPFTDNASIEDALHTWAFLLFIDNDKINIIESLKTLPKIAMRLEQKKGINNCTIINDSYNSDINSLQIALNYLQHQNQHTKRTLILSDILQSGKSETELYTEVAKLLKINNINKLIAIGNSLFNQQKIFDIKESCFYKSTSDFISNISKTKFNNEAILLKGSRKFYFEKISNILEEKVHRTILEINLDSMIQNLNYFRSKLHSETKIMVMVKAFSYGSGSYEIANLLQFHRIDYLGVAYTDEGIALREAGITLPIIVMNPDPNNYKLMIEYKLEPEIFNFSTLEKFNIAVENSSYTKYPIHIKLDTGMHRLGFTDNEIQLLINTLQKFNNLKINSIFSHLAASDEPEHDSFTREQIQIFDSLSKEIISKTKSNPIRHILNSAGIERFSEAQFDMVRLGIGLYGISALEQTNLANVSTLKSTVSQIKNIAKNDTIGYNRKGKANKNLTIAVIPIGYADGLNRKLSNGVGKLYINGYIVPIIGNICMDMCMVDITECNIHEGDEVIIFGKELSVKKIASQLETIPYEIFTSISERVNRVYFQE